MHNKANQELEKRGVHSLDEAITMAESLSDLPPMTEPSPLKDKMDIQRKLGEMIGDHDT